MVTNDGITYCVYCYEGFDMGYEAESHLVACRLKQRNWVPMDTKRKEAIVSAVEDAIRTNLPGTLID